MSAQMTSPFWRGCGCRPNPTSIAGRCGRSCRALAGSFPVGAVVGALLDVPDELPGSSDRIMDLALAGGAAAVFVLLLRWIGRTRRHRRAIKLTAVVCLLAIAGGRGVWHMARRRHGWHAPTPTLIGINAVLAVGLFIPSSIMLRQPDPDEFLDRRNTT